MSVFHRAKERQPEISERVVPVIAVLAKISPGIAELMKGVNLRYGLRGAESLEAAQAQFVPEDFLPSSSYTKSTQGAYATGCAVSREVSVAAAAQVEKEVIADDAAARNGAQPSHLRFTKSVKAKEDAAQFFVFPYSGIGTQGKSSIDQRFWEKFTNRSFISKWFRTCASIADEKEGGISAHMRVFNYAAVTKPIIVEMFLHAGKRAGYNTTLEMDHDIEALFGGAFLGGRLDDGGLNVGDLGSLVLGKGFDGKGRGPQAYAILDTAAVLEQIKREQVEERTAVAVFEDVSWGLNALRDLHQLMVKKNTTAEVLTTRDAKKRGTTVPTLEQITAGEFARWLNAAGGLASAAERKRLHETDDSELTPVEKGKKRKWDGFGGNQQAHANAQAAAGVPLADRDVDPEKEAAWRRKLKDGAAAGGVPLADRDVDPEKENQWRNATAAAGVPLADRDVDPEKENQWRNAMAAGGVPLADRDVDPEKEAAWRRKRNDGFANPLQRWEKAHQKGLIPYRLTMSHAETETQCVFNFSGKSDNANAFFIPVLPQTFDGLLFKKLSLDGKVKQTRLLLPTSSDVDDPSRSPVVMASDERKGLAFNDFHLERLKELKAEGFSWSVDRVTPEMIATRKATHKRKATPRAPSPGSSGKSPAPKAKKVEEKKGW